MFWISGHFGGITKDFATRFGPQLFHFNPASLEYESDRYVPTGEQKQGSLSLGMGLKELAFLGVNFPK